MILKRFFGELPEFPVGSTFESRKDLSIARNTEIIDLVNRFSESIK